MKNYLLAGRYARALGQAVPDDQRLERAHEQLSALAELMETHHDLHSCLGNDAINEESRALVLKAVLERLGAETEVQRLARRLLARDRTFLVAEIAGEVSKVIDERLNRTTADVTSAAPLSDAQRDLVQASLGAYSGKAVRLRCQVDADLIGGVVARVGGRVIDGSLRTRLNRLKAELISEEK
ncbi:MAG: ATP synthase F1 subunit delta [bacterium]|nr:ATP synthase F1 subunit delta [bacterium]